MTAIIHPLVAVAAASTIRFAGRAACLRGLLRVHLGTAAPAAGLLPRAGSVAAGRPAAKDFVARSVRARWRPFRSRSLPSSATIRSYRPIFRAVVASDLERSGLFQPLDPASYLEDIRDINALPRFPDWRQISAEALAVGRVSKGGDGRLTAEFRLWDVATGKQMAGQRFSTGGQNWRRVGHMVADQIYERLTGEKGYFDTRVVFVDETGPKAKRIKRLAIMDQDGANVRLLTQGQELVLTPRFNPASSEIAFMSYTKDQPRVFLMNLETGQREVVGEFPGMTFAPRFSPDGQRVVMSLQNEGNSDIYEMDLRTKQSRRITNSNALDTSPSYSPDGREIVFESDRDGTQQLFAMGADGSNVRRHQQWRRPVFDPGLVAPRRLHRLHEAARGAIPHRRHASGRVRRARPDRGLPQRRPNLGAQRPRSDVLPREPGRGWRSPNLLSRFDRLQRASRQHAVIWVRSSVVAAPELRHGLTSA